MWRLLDHPPGPPRWNMAVDAALLHSHAQAGGPPTLRWYQWSRPTLSLGTGQKLPQGSLRQRLQTLGLAVVRRPTGGRAVLHGGDLTYSIVAGTRDGFEPGVSAVYQALRRGLQAGFGRLGLDARPGPRQPGQSGGFCCFAGAASGDFLCQGKKFVGSAQLWQGQSFLQHGAILLTPQTDVWRSLLGTSDRQDDVPVISLAEILGQVPSLTDLKKALLDGLQAELGLIFQAGEFTPGEEHFLAAEFESGNPTPCEWLPTVC